MTGVRIAPGIKRSIDAGRRAASRMLVMSIRSNLVPVSANAKGQGRRSHPPEQKNQRDAPVWQLAIGRHLADALAMEKPSIRSVCVFCGSGDGALPVFREAAEALGKSLAEAGIRLVYGGGSHGLMGAIARAVLAHGGEVTGIIPDFLEAREVMLEGAQEMIVTRHMHERKQLMFEKADAFIALPGGIGTLEELIEQMTWSQLGQHDKPILMLNTNGFWKPLLVLLAHMRAFHFIREGLEVHYIVADKVSEVLPMLQQATLMRDRQRG
jgi:uncharacterized protein (TIGR00730 family)